MEGCYRRSDEGEAVTLIETYAVDIADLMQKAAIAEKQGDSEKALHCLEEVKRLHQDCFYFVWNKFHTSGTVK